ncbi:MAG: hypothetical protein Q9226_008815 [Calogaya cf. arnoldii]
MFVQCQVSRYYIPIPASEKANFLSGVEYGAIFGEPLTRYVTLDAVNIYSIDRPDPSLLPLEVGDIGVLTAEVIPRLGYAILEAQTHRKYDHFVRSIKDTTDGETIGWLWVDRPVPDPDTRFQSLVDSTHAAGIPQGLLAIVDPENLVPSPTKGCISNECILIIPSVEVYYFGPEPTNTACLASITSPPPSPTPPPQNMSPHGVYVVYPPAQVFDGCRNWLAGTDGLQTIIVLSEWLSTIEPRSDGIPVTKALDFADLPCPPSDVASLFDSGSPYSPILAPKRLFGVSHNSKFCQVAAVRDPPIYAKRVGKISGPKDGNGGIP